MKRRKDNPLTAIQKENLRISIKELSMPIEARALVNEQANNPGLWFQAETAVEAYLQQELRRLHKIIEVEDE